MFREVSVHACFLFVTLPWASLFFFFGLLESGLQLALNSSSHSQNAPQRTTPPNILGFAILNPDFLNLTLSLLAYVFLASELLQKDRFSRRWPSRATWARRPIPDSPQCSGGQEHVLNTYKQYLGGIRCQSSASQDSHVHWKIQAFKVCREDGPEWCQVGAVVSVS